MSMAGLFAVPRAERDAGWVVSLYAAAGDAPMAEAGPFMGPDGFGYLALRTGEGTSVERVIDTCLDQGLGIVLLGDEPRPEWVFPFGNLWSYKEYGAFVLEVDEPGGRPDAVLVGSPSEELLPGWARRALRAELESQGAANPGVLVVDQPGGSPSRSLAFAPMPDPQRLLWYLPPHLGLVNVVEGWPDPMPL